MVTPSRTEAGTDRVRSLNLPRPIAVTLDPQNDLPTALYERNRWRAVARVQDAWQVDDEWWREPISRRYLQVVLRDGSLRTLFHDRLADRWFAQTY